MQRGRVELLLDRGSNTSPKAPRGRVELQLDPGSNTQPKYKTRINRSMSSQISNLKSQI